MPMPAAPSMAGSESSVVALLDALTAEPGAPGAAVTEVAK